MSFSVRLPLAIWMTLFLLSLTGCGEKTVVGQSGPKIEQSQACIDCHQGALSPGTGKVIVDEWKLSHHNTLNGAGCADCHDPEPGHPTGCNLCHGGTPVGSSTHVSNNPDRDSKCDKCHSRTNGLFSTPGVRTAHFNNNTSAKYPGSYVSSQYEKNCRKCHNPHDTTTARNNLKDWATSGHGTVSGFNSFRTKTRDEYDFKTAGSFTLKASQALSDSTNGTYQVCIRCHTTTGYINYVSSGFSDLTPFGAVDPKTGKPYRMDDYPSGPSDWRSKISSDKSKELTNCNACHDNGSGSAYGYKIRGVTKVTTFYNFSSKSGVAMLGGPVPLSGGTQAGGAIRGFGLTFPDVGASNTCVACHSGRMTGLNVKMADIRGLELDKAGRIVNHFRAASELLFRPTDKNGNIVGAGFEFYSSGSAKLQAYDNVQFTHDIIGTSRTNPNKFISADGKTNSADEGHKGLLADSRGYGPCIGCHMNAKGNDGTSHTFLPVNRNASSTFRDGAATSDPITGVTSKACMVCHTDSTGAVEWDVTGIDPASGVTYNLLELQKIQYKAAVKAFARLLTFSLDARLPNSAKPTDTKAGRVWDDGEGRPGTPANWYGFDKPTDPTKDTAVRLQSWLRTNTSSSNSKPTFLSYFVPGAEFIDPLTGNSYNLRSAAYTMGAAYNFFMLYYDPGAFAHNRRYVKRLIFDSMDWLDDGMLNKSVCDSDLTKRFDTIVAAGKASSKYQRLNTFGGTGKQGENDTFMYDTYLTNNELKQASYYLCRSPGSDHRPAP